MVAEQLESRGITDSRVLAAFKKIPRHIFIPEELRGSAYADHPLPIGEGQTISQPYIVALMTQLLRLTGPERILEIGTGSGYQAAVLAELAKEVYSVERFPDLASRAKDLISGLKYANVQVIVGDGTLGLPQYAPFDGIIVTAAAPAIPGPLIEQLKEGGRLVIPIGESFSQMLTIAYKKEGKIELEKICACVFVPLVGKYAWQG